MITIKYRRYWNDLNNSYGTKTFYSLNEYKKWLLDIIDGDTSARSHWIPTSPSRIKARARDGWDYWTHLIERDGVIIFSDGTFTSGITHWNDEVKGFLANLKNEIEHPHYNFG